MVQDISLRGCLKSIFGRYLSLPNLTPLAPLLYIRAASRREGIGISKPLDLLGRGMEAAFLRGVGDIKSYPNRIGGTRTRSL